MPSSLTPSDANVLEKIKDPESATSPVIIDETLPRDPNITDPDILATVVDKEKEIMKKVLALEQKQSGCSLSNHSSPSNITIRSGGLEPLDSMMP